MTPDEPRYAGTSITEPPTMTGPAGSAWRCRQQPLGERGRPDWDGSIDIFLVRVPGAHAFWDHWFISVIHLRPIPNVKPAQIRRAGSTHELAIAALDPTQALPALDVSPEWKPHYLTPFDLIEQFTVADDAVAALILEMVIDTILAGIASPDQDYRGWWASAIATAAEHFSNGTHKMPRPA